MAGKLGGWNWGYGKPLLPKGVRLNPSLMDPNQTSQTYTAKRKKRSVIEWITGTGETAGEGIFRGPDVLAHELLGHGYQMLMKKKQNEYDTRRIANMIRKCIGKQPQRTYSGS